MAEQYDLASGFQTLIRSNEAIAAEIKGLRSTITASIDMAAKFGADGPGGAPGKTQAMPQTNTGAASPTAGQTKASGGGQTTFEGIRQAAMGYIMNTGQRERAAAAQQAAQGGQGGRGGAAAAGGHGGGAAGPQGPPAGAPSTGGGGGAGGGGGGGGMPAAPQPGGGPGGGPGGPAGGPVGGFILRNVPGAGMIASGLSELRSQQDKNNFYRNIEGGTHGNAMGERLREEGYAFGSSMVFGSDEARQAYKGVTQIGYTNRTDKRNPETTRADALDYVYEGKKSRGQSVDEGLMQLETASKSLSVSLGTLNGAMEAVSESAGKAGVNTEMARRQMLTYMNAGIAKGQGAGAVGMAQAITQTQVSYGRDYAATVTSNGMYSDSMMYRASSMSGMTAGAFKNMQRNNPVGAMGALQKVQDQATASAGVTPEMKAWIKSEVERYGGKSALTNQPELANVIAENFLTQFLDRMDPNAFTQVLGGLAGKEFPNETMAARWLVEQVAGNTDAATAKKEQMQVGDTDAKGRMADGTKNAKVSSSIDVFDKDLTTTERAASYIGRSYQSDAAKEYVKGVKGSASGARNPILEQLLQNEAVMGNKGNDTKVEVMTKSGNRVMSLKDAIKEFPNQVSAGKVRIVEGDATGQSVADLAGGIDASRDWKSEVAKDTKTGQSTKDYEKEKKGDTSGGGSYSFTLTPEAQKLVTLMDQGSTGAAAAAATPPLGNTNGSR